AIVGQTLTSRPGPYALSNAIRNRPVAANTPSLAFSAGNALVTSQYSQNVIAARSPSASAASCRFAAWMGSSCSSGDGSATCEAAVEAGAVECGWTLRQPTPQAKAAIKR